MRSSASVPLFLRSPGWYPDPVDPSVGAERWWTGTEWGDASRHPDDLDRAPAPKPATPVVQPKRGLAARLRTPIGRRRSGQ